MVLSGNFSVPPPPKKKTFALILGFKGHAHKTLTTLNRQVLFCLFCQLNNDELWTSSRLLRSILVFNNLTYHICIFENMGVAATNHILFMTLHIETPTC